MCISERVATVRIFRRSIFILPQFLDVVSGLSEALQLVVRRMYAAGALMLSSTYRTFVGCGLKIMSAFASHTLLLFEGIAAQSSILHYDHLTMLRVSVHRDDFTNIV
jgi:hypothetical protein